MARSTPARVAVTDPDLSLTYGQLDARANALAQRLQTLGVGPGVRVGVCHDRAAINVVGLLAILKAGAAYVAMDPGHPEARLQFILRDAEVPVLLADRATIELLGSTSAELLDLEREQIFLEPSGDLAETLVDADDPAYVIYTSGSTGSPKGVQVSHGNLLSLVDWHHQAFEVGPTDRASVVANPAFDASVWELWPYLTAGAELHIPASSIAVMPERLRDWLVATHITLSFVPTPLAETLLDLPWPDDVALRCMLTGGDVLHRRPSSGTPFALVNNYGVAEGTVVSTSGLVAPDTEAGDPPGIGRPINGTRLYVLDTDGHPVGAGDEGELYIGGAAVAMGYLNRPGLTAERFLSDPFASDAHARMYRTGDLVRCTAGDEYEFLGRLDTQVQVRGQRVELAEIAAVLNSHPTVARCEVVGRETEPGNLRLIAYVVASAGQPVDREDLRNHASKQLPGYMVPNAFVELESLPLTSNGKIDRDALPAPERAVTGTEAVGTPVEMAVAAMLAELLELSAIGPHDDFFELGVHSLMAAQLLVRIEERFDVELPMLAVFEHPTAAGIAAAIAQDLSPQPSVAG